MNAYAHAQLWAEGWNKANPGKQFKYIPGCEVYFHPDLKQWERDKLTHEEAAKGKKEAKKKLKEQQEKFRTKLVATVDADDETEEIEMTNALTIENEDETKSNKFFNPVNRRHHLVVLPKNQKGLLSLFGAVSQGYLKGFYRFPRVDSQVLKEAFKEGNLIASSACIGGPVAWSIFQELQQMEFDDLKANLLDDKSFMEKCMTAVGNSYEMMTDAIGRENYYLELQFNRLPAQNLVNRALLEFAQRNGIEDKLIVTCDAHYARPELWKDRELYKKLGYLNYTQYSADSLPKSKDELKCELYPKNNVQIWDEYKRSKEGENWYDDAIVRDAIERTHDIAHQVIGTVDPDRTPKFPNEKLTPKNKTAIQHLVDLCKVGMRKRGREKDPVYIERLKEELGVIKAMKNADYFISYQKIMELAREVVLVGPGRGSGGGSLVAYVLYITDLDPIFWDLPFARFLSVYRQGAPDIDTDLSNRDKVLDKLRDFFGYENVVPISNMNTFKLKTLIKDVGKFHGVPYDECNDATRTVEDEVRKATQKHGDDKNLFVLKYDDAVEHSPSFKAFIDRYPQVAESIGTLFKQNRSLGRHAGGVLICDDLPKKMPVITSKGEPQTPWVEGVQYKHLEYIGNFIKYDLLGLETLRLIERTIELILKKEGNKNPSFGDIKAWYEKYLSPDVINFDDHSVYEYVYHEARWAGIFQLTSGGAQRLFKKAKPNNIIDIATLTSIYRPGPLAANVDKLYVEAKNGEDYKWKDDRIGEILKKTKGLIIFQEQVMELAEKCAGFPKDKCDQVRRAIMKRSISGGEKAKKEATETRDSFVEGCIANGYDRAVADDLYDKILFFAGYGFNKAHAVAYAIDSYWCAWLMRYYEDQWLSAYLESMSGNDVSRAKAFGEIRQLGYKIVPIDVKHATVSWKVLPGKQMMPSLLACKGVGVSAAEELETLRPFDTLEELLWNEDGTWRTKKFNKRAFEGLINVGAFESFDVVGEGKMFNNYAHMHKVIVECGGELKKSTKKEPYKGRQRFYELIKEHEDTPAWTKMEKISRMVKQFGTIDVSQVVGDDVIEKLANKGVKSIDDYKEADLYWFCAQSAIPKTTKNGKKYLLMNITGPSGKVSRIFMWGWDGTQYDPYTTFVGQVSRSEFGFACSQRKMRVINV